MAKTPRTKFVASLERGLRVLQTFSREHPQLRLSEVAALTELSPATAGRSMQPRAALGYVAHSGCKSLLRAKVLALSSGQLRVMNSEVVLQPFLREVVTQVGGSSSVPVLAAAEIVYIAHASLNRALGLTAGDGS